MFNTARQFRASLSEGAVAGQTLYKGIIFWDMLYSPLKVNRHFDGHAYYLFHDGFFLSFSLALTMEATVALKHWLTFYGLHGLICQKIELFITTIMRSSNPTLYNKSVRYRSKKKLLQKFMTIFQITVAINVIFV
jgi:hypothetical protein